MAGQTFLDIRQSLTRVLQDQLNAASNISMDSTLASINSELTTPGRLIAQATPSLVITINGSNIANPNTSKNRVLFPISNAVVSFAGGTITFPASSGTITVSPGTNASITMGPSQFCAVLVQLTSAGQLALTVGTSVSSIGAVVVPGGSLSNLSLGYIIAQTNASSVIENITNSMLYQFTGGGQSGNAGITTIGTLDGASPSSNGAVIAGSNLVLQSASATEPGLVNTTTQTFAGNKTFTGQLAGPAITALSNGFQPFVDTTTYVLTPTTTTGTPAAGTFYSSIVNRATLTDITKNLKVSMGVTRIMAQQLVPIQGENYPTTSAGLSSTVFGLQNDTFGMIRFVGNWYSNAGPFANSLGSLYGNCVVNNNDDYSAFVEITFYGTGLNMMVNPLLESDGTYSVNGGSGTFIAFGGVSGESSINAFQTWAPNTMFQVVSGLPLGLYTVKYVNQSASIAIYGFEILNESSSVNVNPGVSYYQGQQYVTSSPSSFSYSAPVTGTVGGKVLVYQASSGSIGTVFNPVGTLESGTNTNHSNERIVRTYNFREFGVSRTALDDFSAPLLSGSNSATFTLDDDSTTLTGSTIFLGRNAYNQRDQIFPFSTSGVLVFTFTGCGIDAWINLTNSTPITLQFNIYGTSSLTPIASANFVSSGNFGIIQLKPIASGLPYGTYVVVVTTSGNSGTSFPVAYTVYEPALPALPSNAVALADYNVLANFSPATTGGLFRTSTGTLRKTVLREALFNSNNWTMSSVDASANSGYRISTATNGASMSFVFFGTGFDFRWDLTTGATATFTININGSTNLSAFSTGTYGDSTASFTPATGTLVTNTTTYAGNGVWITGLTLGMHIVTITKTAGTGTITPESFDIVTPIHSYKFNGVGASQNTLSVGSQAINDSRVFTPVENAASSKGWAMSYGVQGGVSVIANNPAPVPDLTTTLRTFGGPLFISVNMALINSTTDDVGLYVSVDGVPTGVPFIAHPPAAGVSMNTSFSVIYPIAAGFHTVTVNASTAAGTITFGGYERMLSVREM